MKPSIPSFLFLSLLFLSVFLLGCLSQTIGDDSTTTSVSIKQSTSTTLPRPTTTTTTLLDTGFTTTTETTTTTISTTTTTYGGQVREFSMYASVAGFTRTRIDVNKSDILVLHILATDSNYTITFPDFSVYEYLPYNETVTIKIAATERGEYDYYCGIDCGKYHNTTMRGVFVVN